ncbi:ABC transporter permease [Aestuariivirga sp.]|uniref:ABC transporter permease n=1 Tax=Aestuariivirga sp. TaxID=2650926 RepID=UPI0035939CAD
MARPALLRNASPYWLLVAPFLVALTLLYAAPILNILWLSFTDPKPGLGNYQRIIESETVARLIWTTIRICLITTVFSVFLGYIVAYAMLHALAGVRRRMMSILLVSFWISVLVRSFAWLMLLGHNGLVNNALLSTGLISEPIAFVRNELGVLIGMTEYMIPYAILPLLANMQGIDPRVMSASRSLGASSTQTFFRVFLPLTKPGLIAASLLVFISSLGFYVTPAILGGGKVQMIAEYISVQLLVTVRWGTAAMLATLMLISVLALMYALNRSMKLGTVFGGAAR